MAFSSVFQVYNDFFNLNLKSMENKSRIKAKIFQTKPDYSTILIRLIVGLIFFSEGLQKILYPELLGPGRFEKIGFSNPEFWAYFTATFEMVCAALVLAGLCTRMAVIPLLVIMLTAFITTKWPILVNNGFWNMAHEYRTDFALTLLLVYLLLSGGGRWSVDLKYF
jgi:putative oxidoreductase